MRMFADIDIFWMQSASQNALKVDLYAPSVPESGIVTSPKGALGSVVCGTADQCLRHDATIAGIMQLYLQC